MAGRSIGGEFDSDSSSSWVVGRAIIWLSDSFDVCLRNSSSFSSERFKSSLNFLLNLFSLSSSGVCVSTFFSLYLLYGNEKGAGLSFSISFLFDLVVYLYDD